ncbi:MAG: hypothetical protein F4137_10710 [Acidobacteria bacterium]|nr:hypothetical protein [Acidobacteriota bacterium]
MSWMRFSLLFVFAAMVTNLPIDAHAGGPQGLTAYRPQHGAGYFPFARTGVPEDLEEDPDLGPGIRVNGAEEVDPEGEDDLIELVVERGSSEAVFALERSDPALSVWTTREKRPETELAFTGSRSETLVFSEAGQLTLWVEWNGTAPAFPVLSLLTPAAVVVDRVVFHAFTSLVVALGGENQVPQLPVLPTTGTYRLATDLYGLGWDVLARDEDEVSRNGSGAVYDEIVNAIRNRSVGELAIFGYSHGGGSTYDLCRRLVVNRLGIGTFSINFTAYIDAIENDSSIDIQMELRRPPTTVFHGNYYQSGSFRDGFLDGGPVLGSDPPPSGLNVEDMAWGEGATHWTIDDFDAMQGLIQAALQDRTRR